MTATTPTPATSARFTDGFDPVVLTSPRAASRLTIAAFFLAGLGVLVSVLTVPILGIILGVPLLILGAAFALLDLGGALLARRPHWPWAVAALMINISMGITLVAIFAAFVGDWD